jgi:hypothetical protein
MGGESGAEPPYDGVAVRLGARDWIVPPLNLRQLRRLAPKFALLGSVGAGMGDEQIEALIEIAHASLARNYPDLTPDQVAELIDLANAGALVKAIVGASGLVQMTARPKKEAAPGETALGENPPGEAGAGSATMTASSTGTGSATVQSTGTG